MILHLFIIKYLKPFWQGVVKELTGCLRNLKLNEADMGEPADQYYTQPCSASSEVGTFFYAEGGHLVLREYYVMPAIWAPGDS